MSYPRYLSEAGGQGEDGWEGNPYQQTVASPFNLTVTTSPSSSQLWAQQHTATTSMGYQHQGYLATTQGGYSPTYSSYAQAYLPHPANPYGRGSTDPRDYSRPQYYAVTSADNWQPVSAEQSPYGVPYYQQSQERRSSSESSDEVQSQGSATAEPTATRKSKASPSSKPTKDKKYICKRVASAGLTCYKGFARKADLQRHEQCVHDKGKMDRMDCTFKKCARKGEFGFLRKDHLTEHLRHFHGQNLPKRSRRSISGMQGQDDDEEDVDDTLQVDASPVDGQYSGHYRDEQQAYTGV